MRQRHPAVRPGRCADSRAAPRPARAPRPHVPAATGERLPHLGRSHSGGSAMTATAPVPKSRCLPAAAAPAPPGPAVPPRGCGCARPLLLPPPIRGLRRCRPFPFPPGPRRSRHHGECSRPSPPPSAAIRGPSAAPAAVPGSGSPPSRGGGGGVGAGGGAGPRCGERPGRAGMGLTGCPPPAGQDQGPRPAGEKEGGAAEAAGRPQGGAVTAARGKGDGRGRLQAVQNVSEGAGAGMGPGGQRGRGCCCVRRRGAARCRLVVAWTRVGCAAERSWFEISAPLSRSVFILRSRVVRKSIARVLTVINQTQKENLRKFYKVSRPFCCTDRCCQLSGSLQWPSCEARPASGRSSSCSADTIS